MKVGDTEIEENDIKVIKSIIESYHELDNLINELSGQINEINSKKHAVSEKLELLKTTEKNFIEYIHKKYKNTFSTQELIQSILEENDESSNMCNS